MTSEDIEKAKAELEALQKAKVARIKEETEILRAEQDKVDQLKAEMTAKKERDSIVMEVRSQLAKEMNANLGTGIQEPGSLKKKPENKLSNFRKVYLSKHGYKPIEYGSDIGNYEFTPSDNACSNDVDDWTPDETYANLIWSAFYCKGYLANKVTVRGIDFQRGKGDTIAIRVRGKRSTVQGPLGPCDCLSCVSQTFTKVDIHLDAYGDLAEICELDLQLAGDVVKDGILEDMSSNLAEAVDLEIYSQLITASTSHVATLSECCSDPSLNDCCMLTFDLYNAIVQLEAEMREDGYRPDYIIVSPSIAAFFKYKEAVSSRGLQISFSGNEVSKIGTMSVIEFPCANLCSTPTTLKVVAVLLDSSRAVGEAWGMKPKLEQDRNIDCDSTTVAIHMYVGIDELDAEAIGLISAPSC